MPSPGDYAPGDVMPFLLQEESWPRCHAGLVLVPPSACLPLSLLPLPPLPAS